MDNNDFKKIKRLEKQLKAAILLFIITIATGSWVIFGLVVKQPALALVNSYSKGNTAELTADEWNNLVIDFVKKEGDTMTGQLKINNKVGIQLGDANPDHELVIKDSSGGPGIYIWADAGRNAEIDLGDGTNHWAIYSDESGSDDLRFWRGTNKMVITDDGNVGIGIEDPGIYKLNVKGDLKVSGVIDVSNCAWTNEVTSDGTAWATASCPSNKRVYGHYCWFSNNEKEGTEFEVGLNYVKCRHHSNGSGAKAKAYCCGL